MSSENCQEVFKKQPFLSVSFQNVRTQRLINNTVEILGNLLSSNGATTKFFAITETWLKPTDPDQLYLFQGFSIYRKDRESNGKKQKCGGAMLYIPEFITSKLFNATVVVGCDIIWVTCCFAKEKVLVGVIYRPLDINSTVASLLFDHICELLDQHPGYHHVLIGDWNIDMRTPASSQFSTLCNDLCDRYHLGDKIIGPTRVVTKKKGSNSVTTATKMDFLLCAPRHSCHNCHSRRCGLL